MPLVTRTHRVLVRTPVQAAFEYVSDLSRHPEWSGGTLQIEALAPGPIAVGKEYASRGQVALQKERPNRVRVSVFEPPHRFGFVAEDPDFGEVSHLFTFHARQEAVLVERRMTLSLNPLVALLFRFLVYPWIGRPSMDRSLARLRQRLEQG